MNSWQQGNNSKISNYIQSHKESVDYKDPSVFVNKRNTNILKQKDKDSLKREQSLTSISGEVIADYNIVPEG